MTAVQIGTVVLFSGLVLIAMRVPIALSLGIVSFVGLIFMTNVTAAWGVLSSIPFNFAGSWAFTAVPMFLLMGYICTEAGLTTGLFRAMRIFLSRLPGGLAVASVFACAFFSAASGSSVATASAMGRIAIPEMLRNRYHPSLATGVIAASGTLGSLIPPSILMILYGMYSRAPVGKLFAAGVVPGIISALIYAVMISMRSAIKPTLAPVIKETYSRSEIISVVLEIWPLPVLIGFVLGGIFFGWFSPTQAGAIGASVSVLIALFKRQLDWAKFRIAVIQSACGTASIFLILIGTMLFARFMALSGLPVAFAKTILSYGSSPLFVVFAVSLIYVVLGMFIESIGLLLLTLPIILPIAQQAELNFIWFGIILIKLLEIGLVTPPIGLNVYMIKAAVGKQIAISHIFIGVLWFIAMDILTLWILVEFPALTLWLPNLMK